MGENGGKNKKDGTIEAMKKEERMEGKRKGKKKKRMRGCRE